MAKRNSMVAMCFCTFFLSALATHAANSKQYLRDDDFEFAEWKILKTLSGDLNGDGIVDTVSVGQEVNRDKLKKNAGYGPKVLSLNPRDLGIMFGTRKGDRGKTIDVDGFLPQNIARKSPVYSTRWKAVITLRFEKVFSKSRSVISIVAAVGKRQQRCLSFAIRTGGFG